MNADTPTYTITVRPRPDETDPRGIRALRRLLKAITRSYRFRVVRCEPSPINWPVGEWDDVTG